MYYSFFRKFTLINIIIAGLTLLGNTLQAQQTQDKPSHILKVGAKNFTIRNIGSFQTDSALIFPKRLAKDTTSSKTLKRNGVFFYDSVRNVLWYCDGKHFYSGLGGGLYSSDGSLRNTPQN